MNRIVLLDAGPLGMVTNPRGSVKNARCREWLQSLLRRRVQIALPEIADYEVRRELLRADKAEGLQRLDALKAEPTMRYLPLTTRTMLRAAWFWAEARRRHRPTAANHALDADMILAAQAAMAGEEGHEVVVATTNVGHLSMFVVTADWEALD